MAFHRNTKNKTKQKGQKKQWSIAVKALRPLANWALHIFQLIHYSFSSRALASLGEEVLRWPGRHKNTALPSEYWAFRRTEIIKRTETKLERPSKEDPGEQLSTSPNQRPQAAQGQKQRGRPLPRITMLPSLTNATVHGPQVHLLKAWWYIRVKDITDNRIFLPACRN